MKTYFSRGLCILLAACLLFAAAGCSAQDILITCENAAPGTPVKEVAVSVLYGDTPLEHTCAWQVARGDELYDMGPEDVLGTGYYQLSIYYQYEGSAPAAVVADCGSGELIHTETLADGRSLAVLRFYFAESATEPAEPKSITITCENPVAGAAPEDIAVSVLYGNDPLEHTVQWHTARGDTLYPMEKGDTLEAGYYELWIRYAAPPAAEEGIPVIANCGSGELIRTEQTDENTCLAVIRYHFAETPTQQTEPESPPESTAPDTPAAPTEPSSPANPSEPEDIRPVIINCLNVGPGAVVSGAGISVFYGDTPLNCAATWFTARGDELYVTDPGDSFGAGYYEVHIRYNMAEGISAPVIANCGSGSLSHTEALGGGNYLAVISFYFAGGPETCNHSWQEVKRSGDCAKGMQLLYRCTACQTERTENLGPGKHDYSIFEYATESQHICTCSICFDAIWEWHTYSDGICTCCGAAETSGEPTTPGNG